jgi:DNA-binding NarL/FixJ family response regulator
VPPNGLLLTFGPHHSVVISGQHASRGSDDPGTQARLETTVVVAVESDQVREALVAMLGARDGFRVVAETNDVDTALEAARRLHPRLVLVDPELSEGGGCWLIQQIRAEQLACVVVALGRHSNGTLAERIGAQSYVQMGISPRDLLSALETAAVSPARASRATEAEEHLLADADAVLDKPAFVDL